MPTAGRKAAIPVNRVPEVELCQALGSSSASFAPVEVGQRFGFLVALGHGAFREGDGVFPPESFTEPHHVLVCVERIEQQTDRGTREEGVEFLHGGGWNPLCIIGEGVGVGHEFPGERCWSRSRVWRNLSV